VEKDIIIGADGVRELDSALSKILRSAQCETAMVINKSGQLVSHQTKNGDTDKVSIAALAAGGFASSAAIAQLIGETEFETLYYEGAANNLYVAQIDKNNIILLVFKNRLILEKVRTVVDNSKLNIVEILKKVYLKTLPDPFLNLDVSSYGILEQL
jgi:predicted regulator of Ras-like GTPase activity (Roadblock/LC7/MglB family)